MAFDKAAEYRAQLDHLTNMAIDTDWKQYAWARAKELAADQSGLFAGVDVDLVARVKQIKGEK